METKKNKERLWKDGLLTSIDSSTHKHWRVRESLWMEFFHRKAIRKVVVEESGEAMRKKTKELNEKLSAKGDEETYGVVEELVTLCNKK
ncbi:hypothetical protein MTR67_046922 [Solanum verrucosum]|uniref:Uncharacterized protein n=1 Tax=Solanum verrucosum TaxID=315347 RepID=A0AAF0ZUZ0_SOLVR|nr:hypothetical protein MTR67_046922 [Solanum verrucosum]